MQRCVVFATVGWGELFPHASSGPTNTRPIFGAAFLRICSNPPNPHHNTPPRWTMNDIANAVI